MVGVTLFATAPVAGAIVNGDFEDVTTDPWYAKTGNPNPCDGPAVVSPLQLGEGGTHVAWLGNWPFTTEQPGCDPSVIYQRFDCDSRADYCTVTFDYLFLPGPGETAVFLLKTSGGIGIKFIPPGWGDNVSVSVSGCGPNALVAFGLVKDHTTGTQSVLLIDNVRSECGTTDQTIAGWEDTTDPFDIDTQPDDAVGTDIHTATGACCGPEGCIEVPEAECDVFGKYRGDETTCDEENCAGIPAVSEWGMIVMLLLVVAAGTIVIRRRRAAVA